MEFIAEQKDAVSEKVRQFAAAVTAAGAALNEQPDPELAGQVNGVAEYMNELADFLSEREPSEIVQGLRRGVKAHPMLLLGGALLTGWVAANWLASDDKSDTATPDGEQKSGRAKPRGVRPPDPLGADQAAPAPFPATHTPGRFGPSEPSCKP
jgi:hypothetical protein